MSVAAALLWVPHRVCVFVRARVLGWSKSDLQTKMGLCGKMTASYPSCQTKSLASLFCFQLPAALQCSTVTRG